MPLTTGKQTLADTLTSIWLEGKNPHSVSEFAQKKSKAIYDFVHTGVPTTIITTLPGGVVGGVTAGPVMGTGLGGFDKPVPGMGLPAAKSILKSDLERIWTHNNAIREVSIIAKEYAQALFDYYSQAIILTLDTSAGPLPAPPPAGPVAGATIGIGGVVASVYGAGYDAVKGAMEAEFARIWLQVKSPLSTSQLAGEMSEAIHAFCIAGKVDTIGTIVAPAAVATPPGPPIGSYFAGVGASVSGIIS